MSDAALPGRSRNIGTTIQAQSGEQGYCDAIYRLCRHHQYADDILRSSQHNLRKKNITATIRHKSILFT